MGIGVGARFWRGIGIWGRVFWRGFRVFAGVPAAIDLDLRRPPGHHGDGGRERWRGWGATRGRGVAGVRRRRWSSAAARRWSSAAARR